MKASLSANKPAGEMEILEFAESVGVGLWFVSLRSSVGEGQEERFAERNAT